MLVRLATRCVLLLLCTLGVGCTQRAKRDADKPHIYAPSSAISSAASSDVPPAAPPSSSVAPTLARDLTPLQFAQLAKRFPRETTQSVMEIETQHGDETLALVWEEPPSPEARCPIEEQWSAYDIQSCSGFKGSLAGAADLVRFRGAELLEVLPLRPFFESDDNPSGVEVEGHRGARAVFIPGDYHPELHDVDGDGHATELLVHVGNGPYAIVEYWAAIGVFSDHLGTPRGSDRRPLVATRAAWLDLEKTGRGSSELYCGARCGNTATRWVLERSATGRIVQREFWTCTPDVSASWRAGHPSKQCSD